MKKLIIIAAVTMIAIATNAAQFQWQAANLYAYNSTTTKMAAGTVVTLYAAEIFTMVNGEKQYTELSSFTIVNPGVVAATTFDIADATTGEVYNFFFQYTDTNAKMMFTSNTAGTGKEMSVTTPNTGAGLAQFANMANYTQNTANWTPVPEPTSGLLLLCGLAGLALRRKRA